ncbi:uncharacterized protein LOC143607887 [Bidens hawaiensis]|uniref:uncharacterized protein LOC143607887 n=1 Tax=Bidens hawaiensis TaxID=980011 RepID=UPI00404A38CE
MGSPSTEPVTFLCLWDRMSPDTKFLLLTGIGSISLNNFSSSLSNSSNLIPYLSSSISHGSKLIPYLSSSIAQLRLWIYNYGSGFKDLLHLNHDYGSNCSLFTLQYGVDESYKLNINPKGNPNYAYIEAVTVYGALHALQSHYLDSLRPRTVNLQLQQIIDGAMNLYGTQSGSKVKLNWVNAKCPWQPGSTKCGYFMLKFMKEIVDEGIEILVNDNVGGGNDEYTDADIDGIREELLTFVASFFYQ